MPTSCCIVLLVNVTGELMTACRRPGGKVANSSCASVLVDSDSEEEPNRKVNMSRKRRFSSCLPDDEDRPEEVNLLLTNVDGYDSAPPPPDTHLTQFTSFQQRSTMDSADFSGINDDEMLEAVLEMSRQEAGLSAQPPLEDELTSSPDTGFGDADARDLAYHADMLEPDNKQPAGSPTG